MHTTIWTLVVVGGGGDGVGVVVVGVVPALVGSKVYATYEILLGWKTM